MRSMPKRLPQCSRPGSMLEIMPRRQFGETGLLMCLGALLTLSSCDFSGSSGSSGSACPSCSANTTDTSFGPFKFKAAGDDSTARRFIKECGFAVSGTHDGGFGETLQVIGCGGGVELVWAFNQFSAFRVSTGWAGQTDRGVKIGQSRATAVALDPRLAGSSSNIQADFGTSDILVELIVGEFFRR